MAAGHVSENDMYTCVLILVPLLIIFIPIKGILLSTGNSIVNDRLGGGY